MAAPYGVLNGNEIKVYVNSVLVGYSTQGSLSMSMGTRSTTQQSSLAWKTVIEGDREWVMECSGMYAWRTPGGSSLTWQNDIFFEQYFKNRTPVTVVFGTTDTETWDRKYQGEAYITSLSMEGQTDGSATYSVSFEGSGPLTLVIS
jgi:predicted secreted protein